ncbi:DUF1287 domain-containing protein [Flavobacterium chungnamense]|jgi:uncharacterized protein YijF (DUF1287 family)|uniref:DUF1287 domain-containing protein n=1 Tax=Flavobacterium chungnamense TaxID=706182 RepID=A0ABP7UL87_9FLAO
MKLPLILLVILFSFGCKKAEKNKLKTENISVAAIENPSTFEEKLSNAAISIIDENVVYTPDYVSLKYPNGDVPAKTGVCSDVVIRAYRKLGIDLQKEVHEDMKANFSKYPTKWGFKKTDTNIDHRRVPNLEVFFERKGKKLKVSNNPNDYKTGEIVTWMINGKLPHIGIITYKKSIDGNPIIVHNVGGGQVAEDCLFSWEIVGHFKYEKQFVE